MAVIAVLRPQLASLVKSRLKVQFLCINGVCCWLRSSAFFKSYWYL